MSVGPAARVGCIFPKSPLGKTRPRINPQNGTYFPAEAARGNHVPESSLKPGRVFPFKLVWESASQNSAPKWDVVSRKDRLGKLHPISRPQSGMPFPDRPSSGNCVPEFGFRVGRAFPMARKRKLHPRISTQSGMHFPVGATSGNLVPESGEHQASITENPFVKPDARG